MPLGTEAQEVSRPRKQQLLSAGADGRRRQEGQRSTCCRPSLTSRKKNAPENTTIWGSQCFFPTGSSGSDNIFPTDFPGLLGTNEVKDRGSFLKVWVPCRLKVPVPGLHGAQLPTQGHSLAGSQGRLRAYTPYPSGAEAASVSASGFLSHCCPGLQILRFLPKKQKHTQRRVTEDDTRKRRKGI